MNVCSHCSSHTCLVISECKELLSQSVVRLLLPLLCKEFLDRIAALEELVTVAPDRVRRVRHFNLCRISVSSVSEGPFASHDLDLLAIPSVLRSLDLDLCRLEGERGAWWPGLLVAHLEDVSASVPELMCMTRCL